MELQLTTGMWLGETDSPKILEQEGERTAVREMVGLERQLCDYIGVPHCVCVDSATTGMLLALKAAGVGTGDTVLCTSFSYFAIAEIIELAGARPMFVDINPNTYCIDPYCLEYVVGKCVRMREPVPKALIAVDLFGMPCNYDAVEDICMRNGIQLIEDMAQAFGASYCGRRAGSFGRMAVASFFPQKPVSELGEGGAVFCHSLQDFYRLQALRRTVRGGAGRGRSSYLDSVQSSIAAEKLKDFDLELERRRQVAARYRERLTGFVRLQLTGDDVHSAHTQFAISLKNERSRDALMGYLMDHHIPSQVFTTSPLGRQPARERDRVALVNAQAVAGRILTIPIHPYLSTRVVDFICNRILDVVELGGEVDVDAQELPLAE